jgi:hypothetical protein
MVGGESAGVRVYTIHCKIRYGGPALLTMQRLVHSGPDTETGLGKIFICYIHAMYFNTRTSRHISTNNTHLTTNFSLKKICAVGYLLIHSYVYYHIRCSTKLLDKVYFTHYVHARRLFFFSQFCKEVNLIISWRTFFNNRGQINFQKNILFSPSGQCLLCKGFTHRYTKQEMIK